MANVISDSEVSMVPAGSRPGSTHELAQLAGGLAHEIRNPLSTMLLNLDLLAEDFAQPESPITGGHRWQISVAPAAEMELAADYTVTFPAKHELTGGNRREGN